MKRKERSKLLLGVCLVGLLALVLPLVFSCAPPAPPPAAPSPAAPSPAAPPPAAPPPAEPTFEWRMQSVWPAEDSATTILMEGTARLIEQASEGRIKVTTYGSGQLTAPEEQISALQAGALEAVMDISWDTVHLEPAADAAMLPGMDINLAEDYDLIYRHGLFELIQEGYREHGMHLLAHCLYLPIVLMAPFPFDSFDDFAGKKGYVEPAVIDVFQTLGAVPTEVPGYDIYTAAQLGNIDFFMWTMAELETLKLKEVTKYILFEYPMYIARDEMIVNLDAWEALGPELQEKIEWAVTRGQMDLILKYRERDIAGLNAALDFGAELVTLSDTEKDKFSDLALLYWDNLAAQSPRSAQAVKIVKDFMASRPQ